MTNNMKLFLEDPAKFIDGLSPLVVILTSLGIIVTIMLFIFFYRNRKADALTRHRFLLLFVLMLVHTLLFPLGYLTYENNWTLLIIWFILIPVLFFTNIYYFVQIYKSHWKNLGLLFATFAFGIYNSYLFLLTLLGGLLCLIIRSIDSATK